MVAVQEGLRHAHPDVSAQFREAFTAEQLPLLGRGELDVALVRHPFADRQLTVPWVLQRRLGVVLDRRHPARRASETTSSRARRTGARPVPSGGLPGAVRRHAGDLSGARIRSAARRARAAPRRGTAGGRRRRVLPGRALGRRVAGACLATVGRRAAELADLPRLARRHHDRFETSRCAPHLRCAATMGGLATGERLHPDPNAS